MKICITSQAENLDSALDERFGRCSYFIIYDTETDGFESVANPYINESGGAGIKAAELIANKNVSVVLTGNIGPKAFDVLKAANVNIISGLSGNVKEIIKKYKNKELEPAENPTVEAKFGAEQTMAEYVTSSPGRGRSMGRRGRGYGPAGNCICPQCGAKIAHQPGVPCRSVTCPKCNAPMIRE